MSKTVQMTVRQRCESVLDSSGIDSKYRVITLVDSARIYDSDTGIYRTPAELKYLFLIQFTGDTSSTITPVTITLPGLPALTNGEQLVSQGIFKRLANPEDFQELNPDTESKVDGKSWKELYDGGYTATYGGEAYPENSVSPGRDHVTVNKYYISYVLVKEFSGTDNLTALEEAIQHSKDIMLSLETFKERYKAQLEIYDNTVSEETEVDI